MAKKTCVITGASKGIGLATALRFARDGYHIVAAARNEKDLKAAADQIKSAGAECLAQAVDVADSQQLHGLIRAAAEACGRIDVLVNNAGCAPLVPVADMDPADFERTLQVNIAGIFHATQAVWPIMQQQQQGGVVVNISSVASVDPFAGFAAYGASKAWVNIFTKALAEEGKPHGIRVYAVAPGAVETGLMRSVLPEFPAEKALAPDDVAGVIATVCEPQMAPSTGGTVFVRK